MPLSLLLVLFGAGAAATVGALLLQSLLVRTPLAGIRRAAVVAVGVMAAGASVVYGIGGSYPGAGPAWAAGMGVALLVAVLALAVPLAARRLPQRTVRGAPRAALLLAVLDLHLLINQPPATGLAVTLLLMAGGAALLLWPEPLLRRRSQLAALAALAVVAAAGGFAWRTADSVHPGSYAMSAGAHAVPAGSHAHGGAGGTAAAAGPGTVSVADLVAPPAAGGAVRAFTVRAVPDGDRYRYEPAQLRLVQGERAVVTLRNELPEATSIHWHGMAVPNSQDGVSGLTQDAVRPGGTFTYTFDATDPGSYWFHAHQDSARQVARGLYGAVVVVPPPGAPGAVDAVVDQAVLLQLVDGAVVLADPAGASRVAAAPGERVRLRVVNTDDMQHPVTLRGAPFRVVALDGHDLDGPTDLRDAVVAVPAGGRADLEYTQPAAGTAVLAVPGEQAAYRSGPAGAPGDAGAADPPAAGAVTAFDPTTYGARRPDPVRDAGAFDVDVTVETTTKLGFYDGDFGSYSFINDRLYPDGDMLTVTEGDLVRVRLVNRSFLIHPFHLHGHTFTVLEHDGEPVTGSRLRLDTVHLQPGESWTVAFRADNPGLWSFHCHNLQHASQGMDFMLGYAGVTSPYRAGVDTGNKPE